MKLLLYLKDFVQDLAARGVLFLLAARARLTGKPLDLEPPLEIVDDTAFWDMNVTRDEFEKRSKS